MLFCFDVILSLLHVAKLIEREIIFICNYIHNKLDRRTHKNKSLSDSQGLTCSFKTKSLQTSSISISIHWCVCDLRKKSYHAVIIRKRDLLKINFPRISTFLLSQNWNIANVNPPLRQRLILVIDCLNISYKKIYFLSLKKP